MPGKSMQELSECDELKTFFDRRLIKALGHPVREHILAVLNERIASGSEIGRELGADVSSFYHHVEELEKFGYIERIASKRRRGAWEHFFRAKTSLLFDDAAWRRLPDTLKGDQTVSGVQNLFDDVVAALEAETFNARDNPHVSRTPGLIDAQGWDEATALMNQTLEHLIAIRKAAALRLAATGERGIQVTMGILAFETPGGRDRNAESSRQAP
jgi:DNA-binding transcriptional ArsR family regulator